MTGPDALDRLCALYGIAGEYDDIWGNRHRVPQRTKQALLAAMGVAAAGADEIEAALARREDEPWRQPLPPVLVTREGPAPVIPLVLAEAEAGRPLAWSLTLESGERHEGRLQPDQLEVAASRDLDGVAVGRRPFPLPLSPGLGYHRFRLDEAGAEMTLIVAPAACYQPEALAEEGRLWGPALQLYTLRSRRNWGIGDFTDLKAVLEFAAGAGAGIVGLNPLHALFPHNPDHVSPYSPSSRLFLNALYLDPEAIPGFGQCPAAAELMADPQFQARLRALRAEELVDYREVAAVKFRLGELVFHHWREREGAGEGGAAFRAFQAERGEALRLQALFEALQEHFHRQDAGVWGWPVWPEAYRDPASPEVAAFQEAHPERVEFFQYLQWQAELQLAAAGRRSLELGLGVGLYQDLAVSVDRGGAEAWANQGLYALDARIGAPPDDFNLKGQDWGLPPLDPGRLRQAAYAPFVATLRENMRHAGALRIDHVMGLMRLFWVPPGGTPADGSYVAYPFDDLLGILALESRRNRCLVIGEDLGTVPDPVRRALKPMEVLSYRLLYFARQPDGSFLPPEDYPAQALVAVSTHDLPTLRGYWQGRDLDLRGELALFPSEEARAAQIVARAEDRARLLVALEREGLLPPGVSVHPVSLPEMSPEMTAAVHLFAARAPSAVMMVQLEDVLGQLEQVNLPGTTDQYPNWRRKLPLDLEEWPADPRVAAVVAALKEERGRAPEPPLPAPAAAAPPAAIPRASYRLQLNREMTFDQATELVPYLDALGVSHLYASPYLKARPGSSHGYDIIDHNALNPEIGSREAFERLAAVLGQYGMGQILDMVPNHMGIMGGDNAWWLDVLENGQASPYAGYFDIDWAPFKDELRGKVLVPVLGGAYGAVLESGELVLKFDPERGEFGVSYHEHRFPVDPREYPRIIGHRWERLEARLGAGAPRLLELQSLATAFGHLPARAENGPERMAERVRDKEIHKRHLAELCRQSPDIAWFIEETLREFNGSPGAPASFDALHHLLEAQAYRLAYWRVASDEINYRRFFDVNDLAALRMENPRVFEATHCLLFELLSQGKVDALRIDHPDGLYDPAQYFHRLQQRPSGSGAPVEAPAVYVVIEKILAGHERLRDDWPVHGTTGYDFANLVNGLLVDGDAATRMERIYAAFIDRGIDFDELLYRSKKLIMKVALAAELHVLANQLSRIAEADRRTCDYTLNGLRDCLAEIVACFPVYRSYLGPGRVSEEDRRYLDWAVAVAKKRSRAAEVSVFDFVREVLLTSAAEGKGDAYREAVTACAMKFQQYTGPVMAKAMEDTAFYSYHRLISLNEVGGDPRRFGVSVAAFHRENRERANRWPHAMLATSTHDNKRSEDVRARINVLSELPGEWRRRLARWSRLNRRKKRDLDGVLMPARNDEYLLYQTLVGVWPLREEALGDLGRRLEAYMLKAVREAKVHTSWLNPDPAYEEAVTHFVGALLTPGNRFLADFLPFQQRIARYGMFNGLSQALLKLTAPGVPDIYQGNELWDFSLVDPDNRRPVDYGRRQDLLRELKERAAQAGDDPAPLARSLLDGWEDGAIKLYLTWRTLELRRALPDLFRFGAYLPLTVEGARADHLCAFARSHGDDALVVAVPRLPATLLAGETELALGEAVWRETALILPRGSRQTRWRNVFTGAVLSASGRADGSALAAAELFRDFPCALLVGVPG